MLRLVKSSFSTIVPRKVPITRNDYLRALMKQRPESPEDSKFLKIAVLGCPNSGKSSLVNLLCEWRACGVSGKSHTTRSKQNVVYTEDNIQLVFVDLPGLVKANNYFAHKYERSIVLDPHSAIFQSDLVMVVVDVTHKYSRDRLDPEVLKALHFFKDKESILVLNKIDSLGKSRVELLRITRMLTDGIVAGRCSHLDAFHDRKKKRLALEKTNHPRLAEPMNLIFERLPQCAHEAARGYLDEINQLLALKSVHDVPTYVPKLTGFTPEETKAISDGNLSEEGSELTLAEEHTQIILKNIEDQMMLKSATKEEIAIRRHHWLTLSRKLSRIRTWRGFSDVFMVSSLTGEGIKNLRTVLLSRANSGLWAYNPELISDHEPSRIVKMAFWTHALDHLPKEIYNKLKIRINDCELIIDQGPERVFSHIEILCETERQIKQILGIGGNKIRHLSSMIENELADYFDTRTTVKISLHRKGIPGHVKSALRRFDDFETVFPHYEENLEDD